MNRNVRYGICAAVVVALSLIIVGNTAMLRAQASSTAAAQKAAEEWLALVDEGKYGESWDQAAQMLKDTNSRADWINYMKRGRAPDGKLLSRKLIKADPLKNLPGLPAGQFVGMQFRSSFQRLKSAVEVVVPVVDKDGKWRVSEYIVQAAP